MVLFLVYDFWFYFLVGIFVFLFFDVFFMDWVDFVVVINLGDFFVSGVCG